MVDHSIQSLVHLAHSSSVDPLGQEACSSRHISRIRQVRRSNSQGASANQIARVADDQGAVGGVSSDASTLLQVPGITEENNTCDALADGCGAILDGGVVYCGALAVAAGDDDGVRAAGCCVGEELAELGDAGWISIAGQEVGRECCGVVDTLHSDAVVTKLALQGSGKWLASDAALLMFVSA